MFPQSFCVVSVHLVFLVLLYKVSLIMGSEILYATLVHLISVYDITGLEGISTGLFFLR